MAGMDGVTLCAFTVYIPAGSYHYLTNSASDFLLALTYPGAPTAQVVHSQVEVRSARGVQDCRGKLRPHTGVQCVWDSHSVLLESSGWQGQEQCPRKHSHLYSGRKHSGRTTWMRAQS